MRRLGPLLALGVLVASGCDTVGTLQPGRGGLVLEGVCGGALAPTGCGLACSADLLCAAGLHCAGGVCTAECLPDDPRYGCDDASERCTPQGRCALRAELRDAGPGVDASDDCATVTLDLDPRVPTVLFVVDRSTSMTWEFRETGVERWAALRGALFGEDGATGVIPALEDRVRFGMTLYTGDVLPPGEECPLLRGVAPAFGTAEALEQLYEGNYPVVDSSTPTAQSIDRLVATTPSSPDGPTLFVLATDGLPDTCETPTERDARAQRLSVEAVARAFAAGIETRVLSLADFGAKHVQDLANAGQGLPVLDRYGAGDARAAAYAPGDTAALASALTSIVGDALSCLVDLVGEIEPGRACDGTVLLDGVSLACDAPGSGWRAVDGDTIELLGTACADLEAGRVRRLEARFPCGVVLR